MVFDHTLLTPPLSLSMVPLLQKKIFPFFGYQSVLKVTKWILGKKNFFYPNMGGTFNRWYLGVLLLVSPH